MAANTDWAIPLPCFICLPMRFLNHCYSSVPDAVIHFVHSNEMKDMGGLRKLMPVTHISFLIACLAIAGIPPFSGFFSKEEILLAAYQSNKLIYCYCIAHIGAHCFLYVPVIFLYFLETETFDPAWSLHGEGTIVHENPTDYLSSMCGSCRFCSNFILGNLRWSATGNAY